MKRDLFIARKIQLPKIQLSFSVFFFFMGVSSFAQTPISNDAKFYVSPGATIIDDKTSGVTEKAVIYVTEGATLYNFDKIENAEITEVKAPEKVAVKVKKLAEEKVVRQSSVKTVEPQFHFSTSTSSSAIKDLKHSLSTVVLQQHQIKAAHLTQYHFQPDYFFFLNLLIGVVLLLVFNLLFQAFRARPPPLF